MPGSSSSPAPVPPSALDTICASCRKLQGARPTRIYSRYAARLMLAIVRLPRPVIAEVHGVRDGPPACQLVATCDLALAAEDARFATPGGQSRPLFARPRWWH